ncbi:hypothetical protein N7481_008504 [Penicillium waksmanii]|uniref:uncharacterized protein n=1 Tax=Penicillium waksmanii TaxID=69791 RepID=UPI0025473A96|nr:uncharacterized protein N7481_008504 [Penicillium waksmanii]KAJ5974797.1 hypothetical protein N7481_008504 [Penicillium waksmanii]
MLQYTAEFNSSSARTNGGPNTANYGPMLPDEDSFDAKRDQVERVQPRNFGIPIARLHQSVITYGRQYTEECTSGNPASVEAVADEPVAADLMLLPTSPAAAEGSPDKFRPTKISLEDVALYQK